MRHPLDVFRIFLQIPLLNYIKLVNSLSFQLYYISHPYNICHGFINVCWVIHIDCWDLYQEIYEILHEKFSVPNVSIWHNLKMLKNWTFVMAIYFLKFFKTKNLKCKDACMIDFDNQHYMPTFPHLFEALSLSENLC